MHGCGTSVRGGCARVVTAMALMPGFASPLVWDEGCPGGRVLQPVAVVVGAVVVAAVTTCSQPLRTDVPHPRTDLSHVHGPFF